MKNLSLDLLQGKIHRKECDRALTPYDQYMRGENFEDLEVCKDCFIAILKDILEEEREKERLQEKQKQQQEPEK